MKTIWKYELEPNNHLRIPEGAEPLAVHSQHGKPCLWCLVDPEAPTAPRRRAGRGVACSVKGLILGSRQLGE